MIMMADIFITSKTLLWRLRISGVMRLDLMTSRTSGECGLKFGIRFDDIGEGGKVAARYCRRPHLC